MDLQAQQEIYGIFQDYAPISLGRGNLGLTRAQEINGKTLRYSLNDLINGEIVNPKERLIEFKIGNERHPIFTVSDFSKFQELVNPGLSHSEIYACKSNIAGLLAERMAWTSTHSWLERLSDAGALTSDVYKENHSYANSDRYILKVKNSPNLILLRKSARHPTQYSQIKELDGLFLYDSGKEQYVIVQETKIKGLYIRLENLIPNLFDPLRDIFPNANMIYVLYSSADTIYKGGHNKEKRRRNSNQLNKEPKKIYERLLNEGIGTIFFTHPENHISLGDMTNHVLKHADLLRKKTVNLSATFDGEHIKLWMGDNPFKILKKKGKYWEEGHISK